MIREGSGKGSGGDGKACYFNSLNPNWHESRTEILKRVCDLGALTSLRHGKRVLYEMCPVTQTGL